MQKNTSFLFSTLLFCLFQIYLSSKKILVIEGNNIDAAIKNSMEGKSKLFLIFTVKNCPYCSHALNILKDKVVKNFEEEEEIFFGHVDLDSQLNVWLGIRFNITKIPYIILIENNKIYHFESQFEEELVLKFINEEKNLEEGEDIPGRVTFMDKFNVAVNELTEHLQHLVNKLGLKITWNNTFTYIILIVFFIFFIYFESKLIDKCRNLFRGKNKEKQINVEKKEEKEEKDKVENKEKNKDKKIKKE